VRGRDPLNQALYLWAKSRLANFILTLIGDRMEAVRTLFRTLPERPVEERGLVDLQLHRVLSATLMHERFGMSG
jgi:hypothetical protein